MKHLKQHTRLLLIVGGVGLLLGAALVLGLAFTPPEPVVYVARDALCVYNGKRSRVVHEGYNSGALTSSTQLSENGKKLFYIAPAGVSGTLYCADMGGGTQGQGDVLAQNASALKISPSGAQVVYQTAELDLYRLRKGEPEKLDSSVREVFQVSESAVLYSKYSKSATGQALYYCSLKKDGSPVLVSEEFEAVVQAEKSLSSFYYQTRTPDLGNDPGCHNLYQYHAGRKESELLLRNVANIYQVDGNGSVLFSVQSDSGLTLESVLTDPYAQADGALKAPVPDSEGYGQALAAYQQKQLRDTAREALQVQLERAVKLDVFYCKPSEFSAARPTVTFLGEVELLEKGEEGAFFAVTDWSGVKLTMEEIMTPEARREAIERQTAVTFGGVTRAGVNENLCKSAQGLFRKDAFWVDWTERMVYFLGFANKQDSTGVLYETSFEKQGLPEGQKKSDKVAAICPNGSCMEIEQQEKRALYSGAGIPVVFDGTIVPDTPVQLMAHTNHCCAAFFQNEEKEKEYTLYSIRGGRANLVSEQAAGTLYLRGKTEFLYLEQVDETTGQGRLVLCSPHKNTLRNLQLDTGVSDVLVEKQQKISLTNE